MKYNEDICFDVIIPTKNRHHDLITLLKSIQQQSLCAGNLIVIDQSDRRLNIAELHEDGLSEDTVERINYVYAPTLTGLVDAKREGVGHAISPVIFFLDDDVVLESEYFSEIMNAFTNNAHLTGCSGFIVNAKSNNLWLWAFNFFHKGIFRDPRPSIFSNHDSLERLISTTKLPQGVSAWRSSIFDYVKFDPSLKFHMAEDLYFSMKVEALFPKSQAIIPKARAFHYHAVGGREAFQTRFQRKLFEFADLWRLFKSPSNNLAFLWLQVGFFCEAVAYTVKLRSPLTIYSFVFFVWKSVFGYGRGYR